MASATGKELFSVVDPSWELIDPNPDIHLLFQQFSQEYFWSQLASVYVQWSPRMTLSASTCKFSTRSRECSIQLSKPLLSYRPRKDLVETLLHEMIHAYLFVVDGNRERESHGPKFHEHMWRINRLTGANITVYHSFHDEVDHFKTHWWKCNGPCQHRPPYHGIVKRSMNRAPGPNDFWYKDHQASCGGSFVKIKEPPVDPSKKKPAVKRKKDSPPEGDENKNKNRITNYFTPDSSATATSTSPCPSTSTQATAPLIPPREEPDPFAGRGFVLGSIGNSSASAASPSSSSSSGVRLGGTGSNPQQQRRGRDHPLLAKWAQNYQPSSSSSSSSSSSPARNHASASSSIPKNTASASASASALSSKKANTNTSIEVIDLD